MSEWQRTIFSKESPEFCERLTVSIPYSDIIDGKPVLRNALVIGRGADEQVTSQNEL
jgi:hypothetical protein